MPPISFTNVPQPANVKTALGLHPGVPAKRKADQVSETNDSNSTAKRQKTVPVQPSRRIPQPTAGSASKPPLTPPPHRPEACFTRSIAAPVSPWAHTFPAPTPRLAHQLTSSPVDWTKFPDLTPESIEAYELRAPWNPVPMIFSAVARQSLFVNGKGEQPVEEGVRKRFKKANIAIFELTGVYFEDSAQGLEIYGVKKTAKPRSILTTPKRSSTTATTTTTRRSRSHEEAVIYAGQVVAVQLQAPSEVRPSVRVCDKTLIPAYDELVEYTEVLDEDDEPYVEALAPFLPFSAEAFDHWHSSVCFGSTQNFPQRTHVCREVEESRYMLRVNSREKRAAVGLMLETYVVSQAMGTAKTSGMILSEIRKKAGSPLAPVLEDEDLRVLRYLVPGDPLTNLVNGFRRRTGGLSTDSEYSDQDDDWKFE